jgi:hypothetical protein
MSEGYMLELDGISSIEFARIVERLRLGGSADVEAKGKKVHIEVNRIDQKPWVDGECE